MLTAAIINLGLSRERFASTLGISRGYLSGLEHGKKLPSLDLAVRIDRLTHGAVPVASWVEKPEFEAGAISSPPGAGANSSLPSNTVGGRCGLDAPSNRNLQPNE